MHPDTELEDCHGLSERGYWQTVRLWGVCESALKPQFVQEGQYPENDKYRRSRDIFHFPEGLTQCSPLSRELDTDNKGCYQVTEQDVANGLVLVELDSSHLKERIISQEAENLAHFAELTEQIKVKEVHENQSLSQLKNANLQKKFALMDCDYHNPGLAQYGADGEDS